MSEEKTPAGPQVNEFARKLASSPLFDGIAVPELELLVARGKTNRIQGNGTLIREGEFVLGLHFVVEGSIRILKRDKEVARLSSGCFLGELALFGQSITATATAATESGCVELVIRKSDLEEWFESDSTNEARFFRNLATELCNRLISTTEQLTLALTAKT
jgi:CRP-like cAMP-binding protein